MLELDVNTHQFQRKCRTKLSKTCIDYCQKKKKIDIKKLMPTPWELPKELHFLSQVHLPVSDSPAINLCDAIVRKANMLNQNFRGSRKPEYMSHTYLKFDSSLPSIASSKKIPSLGMLNLNTQSDVDLTEL